MKREGERKGKKGEIREGGGETRRERERERGIRG